MLLLPASPPPLPPRLQIPCQRNSISVPGTISSLRLVGLPSLRLRSFNLPPMVSFATLEPLRHSENLEDADFQVEGYETAVMDHFNGALDLSAEKDMKHLPTPDIEVIQLEDLPDQWRRSRIAWLCKELPAHKQGTVVRILSAQRKWIRQADVTYVVVHCMRIRENETAYRVYSWMAQQQWFHFDLALATKLVDYLGKDRKFAKCREVFDAIIKQGRVPSESTFHILTVAYLSAPIEGCLEEACSIYNKMIQLGGYRPRLSLHNSLFRALLGNPRRVSKHHLKQAEFIYHNLVTSDLEVHTYVYTGLIWLHSYQESVDRARIKVLRDEMKRARIVEDKGVLVSILRACSKLGDLDEAEKTWVKLLSAERTPPSQAFVYLMELYSKAGDPLKSLEMFNEMKKCRILDNVSAYHKIIDVMAKADELKIAETLVDEFVEKGLKPLNPAFHSLMQMYLKLAMHDKLEATFSKCLSKGHPNRSIYGVYLESLVMANELEKAERVFDEIQMNGAVGTSAQSSNAILRGYLSANDYAKGVKVYDMMCQKKYEIDPDSEAKLKQFLDQDKKLVRKSVSLKLDEEQREILIGLLLAGCEVVPGSEKRKHVIRFEFSSESEVHMNLRIRVHERFFEWLTPPDRDVNGDHEIPYQFSTLAHSSFSFFDEQFRSKGRPVVPVLVHRWLSRRVVAYWFMHGGFRASSGDMLLKLKGGNREDIEKIVRSFHGRGLDCKVKRKGRFYWIGFQGKDAIQFWELIEPYVLQNVKDSLMPYREDIQNDYAEGFEDRVGVESDSDTRVYDKNSLDCLQDL